jgi:hypothetical protein
VELALPEALVSELTAKSYRSRLAALFDYIEADDTQATYKAIIAWLQTK